jgi:glycosyltransferase involved in cell wall biosynthesis
MKILVIGNFGYNTNNLNGQTIRTRTIKDTLTKYLASSKIKYFDTSFLFNIKKMSVLKKLISFILDYLFSNVIVVALAKRGVKYFYPIIIISNKIFKKKTEFVAIGGWLDDYIKENPKHLKLFTAANSIYVQLDSLKNDLENRGLNNVVHLPNFRLYDHKIENIDFSSKIVRFVVFSRIIEEKGIGLAIDAVNDLNSRLLERITLDIYGPIDSSYKQEFESKISNTTDIKYKGILSPENIIKELSQYQVLLFPTYYRGEGFPGTILDAFSAGLAVIASDWKYNSEIIRNMSNGLIVESKNKTDLVEKINFTIDNPSKVYSIRKNALLEAQKYDKDVVSRIITEQIINNYKKD